MKANTSRNRTRRAIATAAFGLALGTAGAAHAGDFCFDAGLWSFVGQGFKVPRKGKCKPFHGYKEFALGGTYLVTGTACTPVFGDFVDLSLTSQPNYTVDAMFETIRLPLKLGAPGTYRMQRTDGSWSSFAIPAPGAPCAQLYYP